MSMASALVVAREFNICEQCPLSPLEFYLMLTRRSLEHNAQTLDPKQNPKPSVLNSRAESARLRALINPYSPLGHFLKKGPRNSEQNPIYPVAV